MPELIEDEDTYRFDGIEVIGHDEIAELRELLIGRTAKKFAKDHLVLDDGTVVKLFGNDGGCACSAGCYDLTELNGVDNVITNVEVVENLGEDDDYEYGGTYKIFVYADNQKVNLATFEGDDGNGYYGTGFWLLVRKEAK
jgi:hypothetical protein